MDWGLLSRLLFSSLLLLSSPKGLSFLFRVPAPDAEFLVCLEREFQALFPNLTVRAERFRSRFTSPPLLTNLPPEREEKVCIGVSTCSLISPWDEEELRTGLSGLSCHLFSFQRSFTIHTNFLSFLQCVSLRGRSAVSLAKWQRVTM